MALVSLDALLARVGKAEILRKGLAIASAIGLPVTSWAVGNPTRSLYHYLAEVLEAVEGVVEPYIAGGYLDFAEGVWLTIKAKQDFDVDVRDATYAATDCALTNSGGGLYELEPGDVTARSSVTQKTYHNITGGTLAARAPGGPLTTLSLAFEADEPGASSTAGPGEIDELVTTLLGVEITNPLAAVGLDEEDKDSIVLRCRAKSGALSPNGPRDAYMYVALTPTLTGALSVTRARSIGDSDTGDVLLYLASPSGPVSEPERAAVEDAIVRLATPQTVTPTVVNAAGVVVDVTYELWLYVSVGQTKAEIAAAVKRALQTMAVRRPIGGDRVPPVAGRLYHSMITSTIRNVYRDYAFRVDVTTPAADVPLADNQVPVIGAVNGTIHLIQDP